MALSPKKISSKSVVDAKRDKMERIGLLLTLESMAHTPMMGLRRRRGGDADDDDGDGDGDGDDEMRFIVYLPHSFQLSLLHFFSIQLAIIDYITLSMNNNCTLVLQYLALQNTSNASTTRNTSPLLHLYC